MRTAISAFKKRDPDKIDIPQVRKRVIAGFSPEAIIGTLSKLDPEDPLKPLINHVANGNIFGVCLFAGCNNIKITQDRNFIEMIKILAENNVLILATGCGAGAFGRHGFLTPEATEKYAGTGLKAVLSDMGTAAGLNSPLPLALHMGSCVDNSRAVDLAVALAKRLKVDIPQLPVVASAPEAAMEKAISIGTYAVAMGLPTHIGVIPPVLGGPAVTQILTEKVKGLTGGYFIVESDPKAAANKLILALKERRENLGIKC